MAVKWGEHSRYSNGRRFLERLYDAQGGLCASCGKPMYLPKRHPFVVNYMIYASQDHVVARKNGGTDCPRNRVAMHIACNSNKSDRAPNGCELIFHQLVLARLDLPEPNDTKQHITNEAPGRATLGDIWPKRMANRPLESVR
jgi:hypothetical protein